MAGGALAILASRWFSVTGLGGFFAGFAAALRVSGHGSRDAERGAVIGSAPAGAAEVGQEIRDAAGAGGAADVLGHGEARDVVVRDQLDE